MRLKSILCLIVLFISCITTYSQTNYSDLTNWYFHPEKSINLIGNYNLDVAVIHSDLGIDSLIEIVNNSEVNTGVDVFWVHPTQLNETPTEPTTIPLNEQPYSIISATIIAQGALFAKYGRFFAPRYQQASPASFLDSGYSEFERAQAIINSYKDVKAAFLEYLNNYNNGNKIILAGHSQGSFHLGLLLRDLFDNDIELRAKLITASLAGMAYFHAVNGSYSGGQWENIPLCTNESQCACIHTWRSFKESQFIPGVATTLPVFNSVLVDSGLVFRNVDMENDWFVQDSLFYNSLSSNLRYYIAPDANYNLGGDANFIAFDNLYTARFKRETEKKAVLAVDFSPGSQDLRPNDLQSEEDNLSFLTQGYHNKDYHIYLWAILSQIDAKLEQCSISTNNKYGIASKTNEVSVFPNPTDRFINVTINRRINSSERIVITDIVGRTIEIIPTNEFNKIEIKSSGTYFIITDTSVDKVIVR